MKRQYTTGHHGRMIISKQNANWRCKYACATFYSEGKFISQERVMAQQF